MILLSFYKKKYSFYIYSKWHIISKHILVVFSEDYIKMQLIDNLQKLFRPGISRHHVVIIAFGCFVFFPDQAYQIMTPCPTTGKWIITDKILENELLNGVSKSRCFPPELEWKVISLFLVEEVMHCFHCSQGYHWSQWNTESKKHKFLFAVNRTYWATQCSRMGCILV